jgi:hypothetical protein
MAFTISCVIHDGAEYYTDKEWDNNIHRACLYRSAPAAKKLEELRRSRQDAAILCVIQDRTFNYYDGKTFVYDLADAAFYSAEETENILAKLAPR